MYKLPVLSTRDGARPFYISRRRDKLLRDWIFLGLSDIEACGTPSHPTTHPFTYKLRFMYGFSLWVWNVIIFGKAWYGNDGKIEDSRIRLVVSIGIFF